MKSKTMKEALRELLKEHETDFDTYIKIAALAEKLNPEIFSIAIKKASGHQMMIKEYEKRLEIYNNKP